MTRYSGCGVCIKVCPIQKYGMKPVMDHYIETGEVLGKSSPNLEGYTLPDKGYFAPEDADRLTAGARRGNPEAGASILRNFIEDIPQDMFDAADVDGASPFRQVLNIVLPMAGPVISTLAILCSSLSGTTSCCPSSSCAMTAC